MPLCFSESWLLMQTYLQCRDLRNCVSQLSSNLKFFFWLWKLNTSSDHIYTMHQRAEADVDFQSNKVATQLSPEVLWCFIKLVKELLMRRTDPKSRAWCLSSTNLLSRTSYCEWTFQEVKGRQDKRASARFTLRLAEDSHLWWIYQMIERGKEFDIRTVRREGHAFLSSGE